MSIGGVVPTLVQDVDHLTRFFPKVPELAAKHPELLDELRAVLSGRTNPGPAARALATATGFDPATLSEARRSSGATALGSWAALRDTSKVPVKIALPSVLRQAGLEFTDLARDRTGTPAAGQWFTLGGVATPDRAPTPVLGSGMSASGSSMRVLIVKRDTTPKTLIEWMKNEPADQTVLAVWLGPSLSPAGRRDLVQAARLAARPPVVLLDGAALAYLVCQAEPRVSTFGAIALPFTSMSPYKDTPGETPPEMFFGRQEELEAIKDLSGPSILYGGRQLGKSALLRTAQRQFDDSTARRAVLISIFTIGGEGHPEHLWSTLWPRLADVGIVAEGRPEGDQAEAVHQAVLSWIREKPNRALLIMLDEADAFLEADSQGNRFHNIDRCRRLMLESDRRVKFVFAGLHRTARYDTLPNQPLAHLGQPVLVGPLRPQAAYDLLTKPLGALGFRFADSTSPARVLALANNMPALLQLFGEALISHLTSRTVGADASPTQILDSDIDDVFADPQLRASFRHKYVLTLNLDHRYLVLSYVVAHEAYERGIGESLTLTALSASARSFWPEGFANCTPDELLGLVGECVDLGILTEDEGSYRMRTPTVLRLLGTVEEVREVLLTASERLTVTSAGDSTSYRRRLTGKRLRAPLTERQIGKIFNARGRVIPVAGSAALGVELVPACLEQAGSEGPTRVAAVRRINNANAASVRHALRMTKGRVLFVVDQRQAPPALVKDILLAAEEAFDQSASDATLALVVGPTSAPIWINLAERVDLTRLDRVGLRLLCDEENLPFHDDADRDRLLALTGGWPTLVDQVVTMARGSGLVPSRDQLLKQFEHWFAVPQRYESHLSTVLGSPDSAGDVPRTLAAALRIIAPVVDVSGATQEDLCDFLLSEGVGESFQQSAFHALGDVITTLTALGCLVPEPDGMLRCEPVLARALGLIPR